MAAERHATASVYVRFSWRSNGWDCAIGCQKNRIALRFDMPIDKTFAVTRHFSEWSDNSESTSRGIEISRDQAVLLSKGVSWSDPGGIS